ncbi:MAG: efflux RND transporter periplasmic adaptor subunit [Moritella sp.]|uniref:efflux RND transporter periplasmic adaptor subunit n=1 Tax=Moritella sp. TaxID=78556 RepID=UPI0029A7708F|nr:efflux RND transporter periplasmic adaptor subunit [Moritella sp.]MDX2320458.1 efflux RND transporter periplasmic adaptor subunit [Moritella sp.]
MRLYLLKSPFYVLLLVLLSPIILYAASDKEPEPQNSGPPPMLVEVSPITRGVAEPMVELVGSIRYARVSRVAAEVGGIVDTIYFTAGERVEAGQPLVKLRSDLLEAKLAGTRANYRQALLQLERANKDLQRIKALFADKSVSESLYDENYYRVLAQKKRVIALKAILDYQQLQIQKTQIKAPFNGLVQEKLTEQGEWVAAGGQIAVIADDQQIEVEVDVQRHLLDFLDTGRQILVRSAGQDYIGLFVYFLPQGDVATRSFTVKLKLEQAKGLIAGMQANVSLPSGSKINSLLVPRDAVINQFGKQVIFLAIDGKAKMVTVQTLGYQGMFVAIKGSELTDSQHVVTKGNERIHDGQAIRF